ncbi:c-type cytochrome [Alcanivorax marinus]|uniref:C-type cytochrome n=1 Tax=Alloalcanivorax marinus TaxID=1177169 RepID=A0A9Q3YT02_9GAMM|nr:cytochrome c [Alloalcanivorax marinus]MCC4310128.1 c-type cytochrome [Alloalcanivorax marinus]
MIKRIFLALLLLAVVVAVAFAVYAWHSELPAMAASDRPDFDAATVEKGRVLAAAGYCATCHTAKGGEPYAGNYPVVSDFGTIYASNITPDPDTGIGDWSPEAFRRAMHEGVDREGRHLFPAFPYDHFTKLSDQDVDALYAYLMSEVTPVNQETREPTLPFPLDLRFLQAGWKLLFVNFGRYQPDPARSDAWNRGAYLTEGISHCGACHTPRNALGAEDPDRRFAGATIDRWVAPALTADNPSGVPWSARDFTTYLTLGADRFHGVAAGPMGPVVHGGVAELPDSDLNALGVYLADVTGAGQRDDRASDATDNAALAASLAAGKPDPAWRLEQGARLYVSACAACHYNATPDSLTATRPDLGINSATRLDDPANLIHVMLDGIPADEGSHGVVMPAFRSALDDQQIAAIAAYLRATRTDLPAWPDLPARVGELRAHAGTH